MNHAPRSHVAHRILRQGEGFHALTITCSRCNKQTALAYLAPTAHGLHCQRCITAMPTDEYQTLTLDGHALAAEFLQPRRP